MSDESRVERLIQQYGCLPAAGEGPTIPAFNPVALADAIMHEINRGREFGWTKITLHMDLPDAAQLAHYLRER